MNKKTEKETAEFTGATVEEAVEEAIAHFGCRKSDLKYKILQQPKQGFLGFGAQDVRIKAWARDAAAQMLGSVLQTVNNIDGHYVIELSEHDLILTVYAPLGRGKKVEFEDVRDAVEEYQPDEYDHEAVMRTVDRATGEPVVVGRIENIGERDGSFSIEITGDKMEASLAIVPPRQGGKYVTVDEILSEIEKRGISSEIRKEEITRAVEEGRYNFPIVFAKGQPPQPGAAGEIEFLFRTDKHVVNFTPDQSGRVDYHDLDLIESVTNGMMLVKRHPPGPGASGRDIFGTPLPAPEGYLPPLPEGENIYREDDALFAGIDGHVTLKAGRVVVSPILHVKGDVDYSTGNIDFDGTIRIDGLIEDTFTVRGNGSLFVKKSIGKSDVKVSGNLVIMGGILGRGEAKIEAGGDIAAFFIEHARVYAEGNLTVGELILHSEVFSAGEITLNGTRAALVGGTAFSAGNITVRTIGGQGTSRTHLWAGVDPKTYFRLSAQRSEYERENERLEKIKAAISGIEKNADSISDEAFQNLERLKSVEEQLKSRVQMHRGQIRDIEVKIGESSNSALIHVLDLAHPGTKIQIGPAVYVLNNPITFSTFRRVGNEIKFGPYRGD